MSNTFDIIAEEWRPVVEWEGVYEVSSLGRILRILPARGTPGMNVLKLIPGRGGYLTVRLSLYGKTKNRKVHSLVAAAFVGARPEGMTVNHKDGNKLNNRAENLEYMTL